MRQASLPSQQTRTTMSPPCGTVFHRILYQIIHELPDTDAVITSNHRIARFHAAWVTSRRLRASLPRDCHEVDILPPVQQLALFDSPHIEQVGNQAFESLRVFHHAPNPALVGRSGRIPA